jgi:hypothetical protein
MINELGDGLVLNGRPETEVRRQASLEFQLCG